MVRQQFDIQQYWKVIIFYDVDFDHFSIIVEDLVAAGAFSGLIWKIYDMLFYQQAKAATFSNPEEHISVVLFNKHDRREDYINSIVHEAEHVKQAMLEAYNVEDEGEPPAYTIGYLMSQMYRVFSRLICDYKRP